MAQSFVEVAPFLPVRGRFVYALEQDAGEPPVRPGTRVVVPFGRREIVGMVVNVDAAARAGEARPVLEVLDHTPCLPEDLLELLVWASDYYFAASGELIRSALPVALQGRERKRIKLTELGQEVLSAEAALLRRRDLAATAEEIALLQVVHGETSKGRSSVQGKGANAAVIRRLVARGWLQVESRRPADRRARADLRITVLDVADANLLSRAPRQAQLFARLTALRRPVLLSELDDVPDDVRSLLKQLQRKTLVTLQDVALRRDLFESEPIPEDVQHTLTPEQSAAVDELVEAARERQFRAVLLHGVTGSGKTEVYLRVIADVLQTGRSALVLVPEIALTPQLAARFRARFGDRVAVLHSGLTTSERYGQWRQIRAGERRIVVGARSAVFAPVPALGAVIVDEEHDSSFKQEEGVRYHARDVALMRCKRAGALAVLGSATPSLESCWGVQSGRLDLLKMPRRATPRPLPQVEVVDLRTYRPDTEGLLSAPLARALLEVIEARQQAIVFLNRRGFATFALCKGCGHVVRCVNCSVSLTHHRARNRLLCHYCGYGEEPTVRCPACGVGPLEFLGFGTQKVEQALQERFPGARIARLDRDSAGRGGGAQDVIQQMRRGELDVLVGTQMVTKGHDFPDVTFVGVLCADLGLQFPDFRAAERTFQLLTQVAGRAGRGANPGRVMIQTYAPEHPAILAAREHDFERFSATELPTRRDAGYPPYAHLIAVHADGTDAGEVASAAAVVAGAARKAAREAGAVWLLGPAEAPLQRLKGRTRWILLLKSASRQPLRRVAEAVLKVAATEVPRRVRISIDVDPVHML